MQALPIVENVPLAPYTTLRVGGPARFLLRAKTEEQVVAGFHFARKSGCPLFILGGGSNLVVSDLGFPGLAIKIELSGMEEPDEDKVSAAAGEEWEAFVHRCVERDLAGIECLSGIPGTVGGTPVQNVGAYGQEASEVISHVRVLDRGTDSISELSNAECKFAYRASIFNTSARDRYIVLRVAFALSTATCSSISVAATALLHSKMCEKRF
jgi:UDP-N-acetylmuramate dehydrogenase